MPPTILFSTFQSFTFGCKIIFEFNTKSTWVRNGKRWSQRKKGTKREVSVLSCFFHESLSAMEINFSCRSLYRRSPKNALFLILPPTLKLVEGTKRKHIKTQHFCASKHIGNSRKVLFVHQERCFLALSYHSRSFTPSLSLLCTFHVPFIHDVEFSAFRFILLLTIK